MPGVRAPAIDPLGSPSRQTAIALPAGPREAGADCPYCDAEVAPGEPVLVCQACGTVHHQTCWMNHDRCGSYDCAPARRDDPSPTSAEPKLVISASDLDRAVPLPPRRLPPGASLPGAAPRPKVPRVNRVAIASLVVAVAGIPLFGIVTGLAAIILGAIALGSIERPAQKGTRLSAVGVLLGLADMVGWAIFLYANLSSLPPAIDFGDQPAELSHSTDFAPRIRQAMQANVLIVRQAGWRGIGGVAIGSGVILEADAQGALIVTNRHVIDPNYPGRSADPDLDDLNDDRLHVRLLGQNHHQPGRVVWVAPHGIDLALLRVANRTDEAHVALWEPRHAVHVGDPVFAIGNPQNLTWSHTQGVISQFRTRDFDGHSVRIIQTQAAINPGNSGGGLYDDRGFLIGINTWTNDKRVSEGLGFAIALSSLLELNPPGLSAAGHPDEPPAEAEAEPALVPGPPRRAGGGERGQQP